MDVHLIFLLLLPLIAISTQQPAKASSSSSKEDLMLPPDFPDFSDDNRKADLTAITEGRLMDNLLSSDFLLNKLEPVAEFIDFKLRSFRLLGTLMTRDNFYLLRRFLFYITKVSNFISGFMPEEPEQAGVMETFFREEPSGRPLEKRTPRSEGISDFHSSHNSNAVSKRSADGEEDINLELVENYLEKLEKWRTILEEK